MHFQRRDITFRFCESPIYENFVTDVRMSDFSREELRRGD